MSGTGETFYSGISDAAAAQLKAREELASAEFKTTQQVSYLNSNTGFVKVTSGVDAITRNARFEDPDYRRRAVPFTEYQDLQQGDQGGYNQTYYPEETSAYLARRVILFNGTSKADGSGVKMRSGIDFDGIPLTTSDKAYNHYNSLGIRPMPGITSFDIQSYNPYGTLRVANVKFVVHTLEDLDLVEKLFLRPGYSCIVEWGHTDYINNSGEHKKPVMGSTTLSNSTLFDRGKIVDVENEMQQKRINSSFNYDAFFGYVTNFDYVFRPDGGFDCSMKIASKGQVLDSIKSGTASESIKITPKEAGKKKDGKIGYIKSIFHFWLTVVAEYHSEALKGGPDTFTQSGTSLGTIFDEFSSKNKVECVPYEDLTKLYNSFHAIYTDVTEDAYFFAEDVKTTYIPLRFLLEIFNLGGSLYDRKGADRQTLVEFETVNSNKYNRFPGMFSTKIHKVLIPTEKEYNGIHYGFLKFTNSAYVGSDTVYPVNDKLKSYSDGNNKILDLHISIGVIFEKLEALVKDVGDSVNFIDFIKGVLSEINGSLGNITNLDVYFNETADKFEIVDRNGPKPTTIPKINLTGLKSTVKNLNIASSVTNNIAAQIAIAAQGRDTTYPTNVRSIRGWNEGYVDRFFVDKLKPSDQEDKTPLTVEKYIQQNQDIADQTKQYYELLFDDGKINLDTQDKIENELNSFLIIAYQRYLFDNQKPSPIPIPVNLDITMKGFSGLKIGQSFKVQDSLLLPKYKKYCFIVVGLEHQVQNNEWTTSIRAQFFDTE